MLGCKGLIYVLQVQAFYDVFVMWFFYYTSAHTSTFLYTSKINPHLLEINQGCKSF